MVSFIAYLIACLSCLSFQISAQGSTLLLQPELKEFWAHSLHPADHSNIDNCGYNNTLEIVNQTDIDQLNNCTTYVGDIIIVGNFSSVTLPPNLVTIVGGIGAIQIPLTTIRADGLINVGTDNEGIEVNDLVGPFAFGYLPLLSSMVFPNLKFIGGLFGITNSPLFQIVDGFPALSHIGGSVQLIGDFKSVSLPSLQYVGGNFHVESSNDSFQCPFPDLHAKGVVHGTFFCGTTADLTANQTTNGSSPGVTGHPPPASNSAATSGSSQSIGNGLKTLSILYR